MGSVGSISRFRRADSFLDKCQLVTIRIAQNYLTPMPRLIDRTYANCGAAGFRFSRESIDAPGRHGKRERETRPVGIKDWHCPSIAHQQEVAMPRAVEVRQHRLPFASWKF